MNIICSAASSSDRLEVVPREVRRGWSFNPLDLVWWAIVRNAQTAENAALVVQDARLATEASLRNAQRAEDAAVVIEDVSGRLQNSRVLLDQNERLSREAGVLGERLAISEAGRLDAEQRLQRLLSQPTPTSAVEVANAERDARTRALEKSMMELKSELQHIKVAQSERERQLQTFKESLAAIIDPEENNINSLLTKTAAKMAELSEEKQIQATLYRNAIIALEKEIREREKTAASFASQIASLEAHIRDLSTAARRFEGNGYTKLFDIIKELGSAPTKQAVAKAEQDIIAHITYARLLTPDVRFSKLMELDGQEMWIDRLLGFCKYTDCSDSGSENASRLFAARLSGLLIDGGGRFVKNGGRPINYDKTNLDTALRSGGLLGR
jgi:hypothetical protein